MNYKNFKKSKQRVESNEPSGIFFKYPGNDWSTNNQFYKYGDNDYICRGIKVKPGNYTEFKIADENYSSINFGSNSERELPIHKYVELSAGTNQNAKFYNQDAYFVDAFLKIDNNNKATIFIKKSI